MSAPRKIEELERLRPAHDPATCERGNCGRCRPAKATTAPPVGPNPHDASAPPPKPDPTVRSIGLPAHPDPNTIASALEEAAKAIRSHMLKAVDMASVLAAKGYSARTLGDGGSRGTDTTSSTERIASRPSNRWDAVDYAYASLLRAVWMDALSTSAQTDELLRHASDVDPVPAGQGECRACVRFVKRNPNRSSDRIVSGLCQTCYRSWRRYVTAGGPMQWSEWVAQRREGFTERDPHGNVVRIHTPEPDHDLEDVC